MDSLIPRKKQFFNETQGKKETLFSKISRRIHYYTKFTSDVVGIPISLVLGLLMKKSGKNKNLPLGLCLKIKKTKLNLIKIQQKTKKYLTLVLLMITKEVRKFLKEIRLIYKKPTRYVSHLSIIAILFLVVFSELLSSQSSVMKVKETPSPIGFKLKSESFKSDILDSKRIASLASVLDPQVTGEANDIANSELKKSLIVSRNNFLSKISTIKTTIPEGRPRDSIVTYVVEPGDTLWSIASMFSISTSTIKWANDLADEDEIKPGETLKILPVTGVLHIVADGDTIGGIAAVYDSSAEKIIYQNDLEDSPLASGMKLIIPDGYIDEPEPEPEPSYPSYYVSTPSYYYGGGGNTFPWGYCTWWVANKRYVPWSGNAWQWYYNAQAMGYATGSTPRPGSIFVSWESWVGHVGYVESVSGNSYTISEMNYYGYGVVNTRTITPGSVPLIGFIY